MPLPGPKPIRNTSAVSLIALLILVSSWTGLRTAGQEARAQQQLVARGGRLFSEAGFGLRSLKRDSAGRYYILASPANSVLIYGPDGKRVGQIPNANSKDAKIVFGVDMDVDPDGRVFVADRGANEVKIFAPDGSLVSSVRVAGPTSIACLSGGDFAVTLLRSLHLLTIFNEKGMAIRSFGNTADASPAGGGEPLVDLGRVVGDSAGRLFFAFATLRNPTFRIYDRFGFASADVSLPASQFASDSNAIRVDVFGIPRRERTAQNPLFNAVGGDSDSEDVWAAVGNTLYHFDKDGRSLASYKAYTAEGTAVQPVAILVESKRILLGSDPLGVFEFTRPDKSPSTVPATKQE
jgi:hypothetical protein